MDSIYYTLKYRKSVKTLRLEYGQLSLKFVLRIFEGRINRMGEQENLLKWNVNQFRLHFRARMPKDLIYYFE